MKKGVKKEDGGPNSNGGIQLRGLKGGIGISRKEATKATLQRYRPSGDWGNKMFFQQLGGPVEDGKHWTGGGGGGVTNKVEGKGKRKRNYWRYAAPREKGKIRAGGGKRGQTMYLKTDIFRGSSRKKTRKGGGENSETLGFQSLGNKRHQMENLKKGL